MGNVKIMDGDILFSHCQTLVIPVSCHGIVLGKNGLRWVRKYPEMVRKYQGLCKQELLKPGLLWIYRSVNHILLTMPVCISNGPMDLQVIRLGLDKLLATYKDKGITSLAMPILYDGDAPKMRKQVKDLQMTYLNKCQIQVEIYERYVPHSCKMVPLLEKLCGPLSDDKVKELKKKICFEFD